MASMYLFETKDTKLNCGLKQNDALLKVQLTVHGAAETRMKKLSSTSTETAGRAM